MCLNILKILLILFPLTVFSLQSDRNKIIHVDADSAELDQKNHTGIYTGHVIFNQGTTHLHAAKAITQGNEKNELVLAIAEGNQEAQAHFETKTAEDKPPMHAYADIIRYLPDKHRIELQGHAKVSQGTNSFSAPLIVYDTEKQQVISKSDGKSRTSIVFYPDKKP